MVGLHFCPCHREALKIKLLGDGETQTYSSNDSGKAGVDFWQLPSVEAIAERMWMMGVCCPRREECELVHVKITVKPNPG